MIESKQKIVLFDIDYTLFNAQSYRDVFQEALFKELGENLPKEQFITLANETYIETKKQTGHFDPDLLISTLARKLQKDVNLKKLTELVIDDAFVQASLYKETLGVFKRLSQESNLTLGIFSAGRIDLQTSKIRAIESFLHKEHIHIFEYKKVLALPDLLKRYAHDKLYIIDDVLSILSEAKTLYNTITTIWIRRGIYKDVYNSQFIPDATITNLEEVIPILTR